MSDAAVETCPGCGLQLPASDGATHSYIGASPSCWAVFGEVLAREYGDATFMKVHQLTVDAYAVQHPGKPEPRAVRSVWGHLASLYLQLDQAVPPQIANRVIGEVAAQADLLGWIEPPGAAAITIADVAAAQGAAEHAAAVERWARAVWACWSEHRDRVAEVAEQARSHLAAR
jgi:hypothetical protein